MPTTRETILKALHMALPTQRAPVLRGEVLPESIQPVGHMILRDQAVSMPGPKSPTSDRFRSVS